jgi:hypothetical protein
MKKKTTPRKLALIPIETVARRVYVIRGERVMLDSALAELYQIPTFRLNEAVKRNKKRFPQDFMFQLTKEETANLTSQIAMSSYGGRRTQPFAFTELGVAMLSSVLNSDRAVQMNIVIMRTFVKLREMLAANKDLAYHIEQIEETQRDHASMISLVMDEINALKEPPAQPRKKRIGFTS